jgi:hypothetical protein
VSGEAKNVYIIRTRNDAAPHELKELLQSNGYTLQDSLVDSPSLGDADEDRSKETVLAPRIDRASILLVLISPTARAKPLVDWAIGYAASHGKRIVGVYAQGGQTSDLPVNFHMYGDALVVCQAERVLEAASGTLDTWFKPDDTEFPERDIERFTCGEPEPE